MKIGELIELIPYDRAYAKYLDDAKNLYETSFPIEERREWIHVLRLLEKDPRFGISFLFYREEFAGFLNCWSMDSFCYGEHLAVVPSMRGVGLGRRLVSALWSMPMKRPWVFEVEPPESEIAARRLAFYLSLGAEILSTEYVQPPYRKGEEGLPLYFMGTGAERGETDYYIETVKRVVYSTCA